MSFTFARKLTSTFFLFFIALAGGDECADTEGKTYTCPLDEYPSHHTKCCYGNDTLIRCCPSRSESLVDSLVMMISIFVILLCLTLAVFFVICCFWSPCPLYSVCRINYTYGDIVAYTKEEEALNLPPDASKKNAYTPLHVTVKAVEET